MAHHLFFFQQPPVVSGPRSAVSREWATHGFSRPGTHLVAFPNPDLPADSEQPRPDPDGLELHAKVACRRPNEALQPSSRSFFSGQALPRLSSSSQESRDGKGREEGPAKYAEPQGVRWSQGYGLGFDFPGKPAGFSCVRSRNVPRRPAARPTFDSPNLSRTLSAAVRASFQRRWRFPSSRSI